jgi:hypothetical protein
MKTQIRTGYRIDIQLLAPQAHVCLVAFTVLLFLLFMEI